MFEIIVFCVILFAIGYSATLYIVGRRDDVLHGNFVEPQPEQTSMPATSVATASPQVPAAKPGAHSLQSLLVCIQQDLKNASEI